MTARTQSWLLIALMVGLALGMAGLSYQMASRTESLLQRTLTAYEQLALVTRLEASITRERLAIEAARDSEARSSDVLFTALQATVDRELTQVSGVAIAEEQTEFATIQALIRARDDYLRTGDSRHWQRLVALLASFEQAETAEVDSTLATLARERSRITGFLLAVGAVPLIVASLLLWQLFNQHRRLEKEVASRTLELADKAEALQRTDQQRRLFFAKLSHELRTPLTVLAAEAEVAAHAEASPARVQQAISVIEQHAHLLSRRFSDLLALARSDAGELVLSREPVELMPLLGRVFTLTRGLAERAGVTLVTAIQGIDDEEILADSEWLMHGVMALIDNAVKASAAGQRVTLSAYSQGHQISIEVCDQGPGVAASELSELTEPFKQTGSYENGRGTGLGLAVMQWVAREHGGTLQLTNRPEGGFSARVQLPRLG